MKKNDWVGIGFSVGVHLCLLLLFALITSASNPAPIGYIEVDFGPITRGQPVQRAAEPQPEQNPPQPDPVQPESQQASQPETVRPVEAPKQPDIQDPEVVRTPEAERVDPNVAERADDVREEPRQEPRPVRPLGSGEPEGTVGASQGRDGAGSDETKTAPFSLEGLNRDALRTPLPEYPDRVNADIQMRIWVGPAGRVVRMEPIRKASPALESAVMQALRAWQFNPLPANAPQENQIGVVTFRFRLE